MTSLFEDILKTDGVKGVFLISFEGKPIFKKTVSGNQTSLPGQDEWSSMLKLLDGAREVDLVFEHARLYLRKTTHGYLIIWMGLFAPVAMVRLNCDILLPALKHLKFKKRFGDFLKKEIKFGRKGK